ncbi:MAG: YkgJ family cysteine cluster protein [Candidatus Helarchaeota archaeon]|nr:YkgJ family cysteine cluster protein [Candidatus Helarchaeota archaeon]
MVGNSKPEDEFNYFSVCESCTDEECCADPYFTFCARNEIEKIREKIKNFPDRFRDFLDADTVKFHGKDHEYYGFKKVNGRCIFLKGKRRCLIQDVKPLHCRAYPLVWGYEEEGNKLFIYFDEDSKCPLTDILYKNKAWIQTMKKIIVTEVQQMPKVDLVAFASLESDDTLRMIDVIDLP